MANELQKLIREAFNIAYQNHKSKKINENVESLKATMSSSDIFKAENAFREIKNNISLAADYAWTPQGSANKKLNAVQFNLLVQLIFSNTDMETKKNIFMTMYHYNNPALFHTLKNQIIGKRKTFINDAEAKMVIEDAWEEMFLGKKTKSGERLKKGFDDAVAAYTEKTTSNFGAYLVARLASSAGSELRDYFASQKTLSLSDPLPSTGKPREIGAEVGDDFGSDVNVDPKMDPSLGAPELYDNPEGNAGTETSDSAIDIDTSKYETELEDEFGDTTLGQDIEGSAEDEESSTAKNARLMVRKLEKSLYQAIEEFRSNEDPTPNQERGFVALEAILTGTEPKDASAKLGFNATTVIQDLKSNKRFTDMVDDYLLANGFVNSRGRVETFDNMYPQWISDAAFFKKHGQLRKDFKDDRRTDVFASGSLEDEEETSGLNMKQMLQLKVDTKKEIKALRQSGNDSAAVKAVESLLTGMDPKTVAKNFGYGNTESLAQDIANLKITANPQDIADSAKSLKYGKPVKAVPPFDDSENMNENRTFWFLEEVMLERFISKNIDKIMERVYNRLTPRLNS